MGFHQQKKYGYGSIPINTIFSGMNIHLPAILMFTRYQGFDPSPNGISPAKKTYFKIKRGSGVTPLERWVPETRRRALNYLETNLKPSRHLRYLIRIG